MTHDEQGKYARLQQALTVARARLARHREAGGGHCADLRRAVTVAGGRLDAYVAANYRPSTTTPTEVEAAEALADNEPLA